MKMKVKTGHIVDIFI